MSRPHSSKAGKAEQPIPHPDEANAGRGVALRIRLDPWSVTVESERTAAEGVIYIASEADAKELDELTLLRLYNTLTGGELRRFPRRSVAVHRTWEAVRDKLQAADPQGELQPASAETPAAGDNDGSSKPSDSLRAEIRLLREQLAEKVSELRQLEGRSGPGETPTVLKVLELLAGPDGATKEQLVRETGAKKGYIDALLGRILPQKGYLVRAETVAGQVKKSYRVELERTSD